MKKGILSLLVALMVCTIAFGDETESVSGKDVPTITMACEQDSGKMYLEWDGTAPIYRIVKDGKKVLDTKASSASFEMGEGTHSIEVYPIIKTDKGDTSVKVGVGVAKYGNVDVDIDLAALGLNAKDLAFGEPSEPLKVDFVKDSIIGAKVEKPSAVTDGDDRVCLSFKDYYISDIYRVYIKAGKSENHVDFPVEGNEFVTRDNVDATIILDPEYLQENGCATPVLGDEYSFSVQLRKYTKNYVDDSVISSMIHESAASDALKYTPTELWKTAPTITYASQTADGQITLQWEHEDNGSGCEYSIVSVKKTLGVATKKEEIGTVSEKEFVISDLTNGDYSYQVIPILDSEKGDASEDADVEIKNDWVAAPSLTCEQTGDGGINLVWTVADGIDKYHITILKGDDKSPLKYVNLDYKKYAEADVEDLKAGEEYQYTYLDEAGAEQGDRFKFEIYGVHMTSDGKEQKSSTSSKSIVIE